MTPKSNVFRWSRELSIGIPRIDREHRGLIDLAAKMHAAMLRGAGKSMLEGLLDALQSYALEHFAHEEELMRSVGYPGIHGHAQTHRDFGERVRKMRRRAAHGERTMTLELLQFMVTWIRDHIAASDRRIAEFIAVRQTNDTANGQSSGQAFTPCDTASHTPPRR